jgi:hypothetical protein
LIGCLLEKDLSRDEPRRELAYTKIMMGNVTVWMRVKGTDY